MDRITRLLGREADVDEVGRALYADAAEIRASLVGLNLGGRYERGAVSIAQQHYTTAAPEKGFKLLVVKINSHVCGESAQLMIEDDTLAAGPVTRALATRFDSSEQHDGRRE